MSIPITSTKEYKQLTKVLEILELQREQVIKDKEFIEIAYKEAIKNPVEYIESLVSGAIRLPPKLNIINVPDLVTLPTYNHNNNNQQRNVNRFRNINGIRTYDGDNNSVNIDNGGVNSNINDSSNHKRYIQSDNEKSDSCFEESESDIKRPPKPFKAHSKTNLAYWTEEEQDKLEKLLVEFPEEEVASHRWSKIANALGNRTPAQVASRTQKYFKKLERLGQQIPGSKPKKKRSASSSSSNSSNNNSSNNNSEHQSSGDERKRHKLSTTVSTTSVSSSNIIKKSNSDNKKQQIHEGYKCDGCDCEPIVGVRWHCEECMDEVDLCSKCHDELEVIGKHLSSHHMTAFENPDSYFLDDDYKYTYPTGESNYLDPNYR